jgi:hypothetical protein
MARNAGTFVHVLMFNELKILIFSYGNKNGWLCSAMQESKGAKGFGA